MKQETTLEKQEKNKKITDGKIIITLRKIIHPILMQATRTKTTYKIRKENKYQIIKNRPVIFVANHYCFQDTPIVCRSIGKQAYILAGKQPFEAIDELFFKLNGSIFVDRKNKKDMAASKEAMIEYLKKGQHLLVFPEGTWNLTDQQLILPLKWGIIDVAKETNAQIIPVILDYDKSEKRCAIKFGKNLIFDNLNKKEGIEKLRDEMATLRWSFIDENKIYSRGEIDVEQLRKEMRSVIDEYPKLDARYEESVIYQPVPSVQEVFAPVKKIGIRKNIAFLYGKNKKGNF